MNKKSGFTMIELIIVIALTGILTVVIAKFIRIPINSYDSQTKRSALVDEAHTIIKKMKRDIQGSLPNSVRITTVGAKTYIEMMLVDAGGKYRTQLTNTGTGDILDFTAADTSFDMLSGTYTFAGGEKIVVGNLGVPSYDAYAGDNISNYIGPTGSALSNIQIAAKKYPLEAVGDKFYIVNDIVTYVCDKTAKTMTRYKGYSTTSAQPINDLVAPLSTASKGLVAKNLNDCRFTYNQGQNSRNGILSMFISVNKGSESINLYGDSYVPNS